VPEKKKTIVTAEQIADFLKQTGFVFEMRMHEIFSKHGYTCDINSSFRDLEGDTEREIDIIAFKRFDNEIIVHFVVECKQSTLDKWIFICTKTDSPRFYYAVKHLPTIPVEILKEKKVFLHFHAFQNDLSLGRNYISYSVATNKKTDHLQIDECVYKLPKALVDVASRVTGGRHLFFPLALFSGQLFSVDYDGALIVKEQSFLQFFKSFKSEAYRHEVANFFASAPRTLAHPLGDWEESLKRARDNKIKEAATELARPYQIDFVSESGLQDYITMVEKEVASIRTSDWPIPVRNQKPTSE
jgi:hypothetical protein